MTEEFQIQCEHCGTIYIDLEEVCPYCGQPQPTVPDDDEIIIEEPHQAEGSLPEETGLLPGEIPPDYPPDLHPEDEYGASADGRPELYSEAEPLPAEEDPFIDDDIFAVADPEWPNPQDQLEARYEAFDEPYDEYDPPGLYDESDETDAAGSEFDDDYAPYQPRKRRIVLGCVGTLLCIGLFYGGIALLGAYHGLQERVQSTQEEAETHYQRGQELITSGSLELAIAEYERALSLNPNLLPAREALRDAQRISQSQPTPTSETRSAAVAQILAEAEALIEDEKWAAAAEALDQVRGLDPDFQKDEISEMMYTVNYQLGLGSISPDQIEEAVAAFERALAERPDDAVVSVELAKALLYRDGTTFEQEDWQQAVEVYDQLYQEDARYLDVRQRLFEAHEAYGDELLNDKAWCLAETQYTEALQLRSEASLQAKAETSQERCEATGPARASTDPAPQLEARVTATASPAARTGAAVTATITATTSAPSPPAGGGSILFSSFNPNESRWEIVSVPATGGSPKVLVTDGTMPSVSPNGQYLVYHSELIESEGFHLYDLSTGEDRRITDLRQNILPRWSRDSDRFMFVSQELATQRWLIQIGFVDGKSEPLILRDGRTPDWSPDGQWVAYQGTDPEGNNPGLYIFPLNGGETNRLTNHESDRSPDFSPDGSQLAYMSTRAGNWDIFTVNIAGSAPRQITTAPGQDGLPVWSPDGSQLAYVSDAGGSWGIYVINASGGSPVKVANWDGSQRPDWLMSQIWWAR